MNESSLHDRRIVCIASAAWDSMWVNAQHLMSRMARNNRILYLNNMGLRPPSAGKSDLRKIFQRLVEWFSPPRKPVPGLWVVSPIVLPLHRYRLIRKLNGVLLVAQVRFWMRMMGMRRPILWSFLPTGISLIGRIDFSGVIYHCVDDYAENPGVPSEHIREMERDLLRVADITFVTNPKLYQDRLGLARRIRYFPNAVNAAHFRDGGRNVPDEIEKIRQRRPGARVLGYQGNISDYKTDTALLQKIAARFSDDELVLVGPAGWGDPNTDLSALRALPNVHFVGRIDYNRLPDFVHAFDVCLVPMNLNESTKGSFPMKFYEYLACGKPVVATKLPAFAQYAENPEIVRLAANHEEFLAAIETALAEERDEAVIKRRIDQALDNDWERRLVQIGTEARAALAKEMAS